MAAMKKQHDEKWKYYVYKFFKGDVCVYVGKGCNNRFKSQQKRFVEFYGTIVAFFISEDAALSYEKAQILELAPQLNKAMMPDAPKPWTVRLLPDDKDFYAWCDSIGSRAMAARVCLKYWWLCDQSKIESLRKVAYG